jgi:hypothetical protein
MVPAENFGICPEYHKGVHLGAEHPACIRCIGGARALNAASCRRRGVETLPSSLVVASDHVIPAQFEGMVMA